MVGLPLVLLLLAPLPVSASTHYVIIADLRTSTGRLVWTLTATVDVPDSTLDLRIPQRLYDLVVSTLGTDTFTTPFSIPLANGALILSVNSVPPGLTVKLVPVPPGEVIVDGRVDILDAATLAYSYSRGPGDPGYSGMADFDLSGSVDILDAAVLAMNYGRSY